MRARITIAAATLALAISGAATQIASAADHSALRVALDDIPQTVAAASAATNETPVFVGLAY